MMRKAMALLEGSSPSSRYIGADQWTWPRARFKRHTAAAGKCLGQLLGEAVGRFCAVAAGARYQSAAGEQGEQQARADEEGDLEAGVAPPLAERLIDRLEEGQLRIGLGDVADGDDGVGAVEEGDAQHAGLGAEGGERLLRAENGEQISGARSRRAARAPGYCLRRRRAVR